MPNRATHGVAHTCRIRARSAPNANEIYENQGLVVSD